METQQRHVEPRVRQIRAGWAAFGDGWAVHARTRDEVIAVYWARKQFYDALDALIAQDREQEASARKEGV
jgi:hypothetical protein